MFVMFLMDICEWKPQAEYVTKRPDSVFTDDYWKIILSRSITGRYNSAYMRESRQDFVIRP